MKKLYKMSKKFKKAGNIKAATLLNFLIAAKLNPIRLNMDYGAGLYNRMHEYHSVADFLKGKKKKKKN